MVWIFSMFTPVVAPCIISALLLFILVEQISYLRKRRHLPGPHLFPPFIGNAVPVIRDPTSFWDDQSALAMSSGVSANYLVGKFIVYIRDTELSHRILSNVRPDAFLFVGHPFGKKLFGDRNMIYLFGEDHKSIRRQIAPNFNPKGLSTYSTLQQVIIVQHLKKWAELSRLRLGAPMPLRPLLREMNLETSQSVFVGPYPSREEKYRFSSDYDVFNVGSMALPIDSPVFAFGKARRAVIRLMEMFAVCAGKSKSRMAAGEEPACFIDFWMKEIVEEIASGKPQPPHSDDEEIGGFLFDLLFAAQDASTSSLLWAVALLDSHPEVLEKVRKEVSGGWSPESDGLITADQLAEMKYTRAVAREVVRYRAPATLVPHIAMKDFPLTETDTIPKGAIVFPSVFDSCFQGSTEPDLFDPDRFSPERQEDQLFKRNFLAFGSGPHQGVGQRYALNHLVIFIVIVIRGEHGTDGIPFSVSIPIYRYQNLLVSV